MKSDGLDEIRQIPKGRASIWNLYDDIVSQKKIPEKEAAASIFRAEKTFTDMSNIMFPEESVDTKSEWLRCIKNIHNFAELNMKVLIVSAMLYVKFPKGISPNSTSRGYLTSSYLNGDNMNETIKSMLEKKQGKILNIEQKLLIDVIRYYTILAEANKLKN